MSGGNKQKKKENKEEKRKLVMAFVCLILVFSLLAGFLIKIGVDKALYNRFEDRGLPRINIDLNGVSLREIKEGSKVSKYKENTLQIYNNGIIKEYDGIEIKGRGNTTWLQKKKPYQIKFDRSIDLFGLGKAKKWVLLANYYDVSMLRTEAGLMLSEMLDMPYSKRGEFVELYFDGEYEGVYYLLHKVEIAKNSVNLREAGGLLIEIDTLHRGEVLCYTSYLNECLVLRDSVINDTKNERLIMDDFMNEYNEFEKALVAGDYNKIKEIIDISSFARFYLINEFAANPDAYSSSFYLYRDGVDDKIHAGPVWDFDFSFANKEWAWRIDDDILKPDLEMARKKEVFVEDESGNEAPSDVAISKVFYYLMDIPEFKVEVAKIFREKLSGRWREIDSRLSIKRGEIANALEEDARRWGIDEIETVTSELLEWIKERFEFFEELYEKENLQIHDIVID